MKTLLAPFVALFLMTSVGAQEAPTPAQFAFRSAIQIHEKGAYQQLGLTLPVYQGALSPNLADLRVFNAAGEALPYAFVAQESSVETRREEQSVPIFPLRAPAGPRGEADDVAVSVRQTGDGTLVSVRKSTASAGRGAQVRGLLLDASKLKGSVRSLRLVTRTNGTPIHAYTIESSHDLQHWRMLKSDAQLVHLAHDGHRIDIDSAEWEAPADRYLRLLWADPQRAPAVSAVLLSSVESQLAAPPRLWSAEIRPGTVGDGEYDYAWAGQMPLEMLRINLPQINSLAPLTLQRPVTHISRVRHREELRWSTLAHSVVFRLESPQGEIRSPDIALHEPVVNRLRLSLDRRAGTLGDKPPTLQIGFVPGQIVFLARGEGPFILAWGASGLARADLPLTTLVPSNDGKFQLPAKVATLGPPESLRSASSDKPAAAESPSDNKWILWLVLLGGLLVLGGMARALTRQLRQGREAE